MNKTAIDEYYCFSIIHENKSVFKKIKPKKASIKNRVKFQ